MNDDRFDDDLRSTLLADAPREVPGDLRRRVAAIPVTLPAPSTRRWPAWRPVALAFAGLATLALLAIGLWRIGSSDLPGVGGAPTPSLVPSASAPAGQVGPPSSTSPRPSPRPSPVPSPTPVSSSAGGPAVAPCGAADLTANILDWQGAAGSRIADVEVTNASSQRCTVRGTPALALVDGTGRVLLDSTSAGASGRPHVKPTDPSFEVAPGGHLKTQVRASNYCGAAATAPITIALTLPGGGRVVAQPAPAASGLTGADAVPPCMGSAAGTIEMNGWAR